MPVPFPNAICGTTASNPGSGNFTPNAAATGCRPWSKVNPGWWGLVHYADAAGNWEDAYSYWDGTALSRGADQVFDSSTGSLITFTDATVTASLVIDGQDLPQWTNRIFDICCQNGNTTVNQMGPAPVVTGTAASISMATGTFFSEQMRIQHGSATTANAQAGWNTGTCCVCDTTAGRGGGQVLGVFGCNQLPTNPRFFLGYSRATVVGSTSEPSALLNIAAFAKDSTDTNLQFMVNDGAGVATKVDTGIPMVAATTWLYWTIWIDPGMAAVRGLLAALDSGAIWYGVATTNLPATGLMLASQLGGLNGTNTGTAIQMHQQRFVALGGTN